MFGTHPRNLSNLHGMCQGPGNCLHFYKISGKCPLVLSWPTSRTNHLWKLIRNAKKPLFRSFWGLPGVDTRRVTGASPVSRVPVRGSPSSHYTPIELKLLLNSLARILGESWRDLNGRAPASEICNKTPRSIRYRRHRGGVNMCVTCCKTH